MKNGFQILYDWMVSDLHLKGSSVQVFAIIYGLLEMGKPARAAYSFSLTKQAAPNKQC